MTADGAWTLWALKFKRCLVLIGGDDFECVGGYCHVNGLLSFLFFVLMAGES